MLFNNLPLKTQHVVKKYMIMIFVIVVSVVLLVMCIAHTNSYSTRFDNNSNVRLHSLITSNSFHHLNRCKKRLYRSLYVLYNSIFLLSLAVCFSHTRWLLFFACHLPTQRYFHMYLWFLECKRRTHSLFTVSLLFLTESTPPL